MGRLMTIGRAPNRQPLPFQASSKILPDLLAVCRREATQQTVLMGGDVARDRLALAAEHIVFEQRTPGVSRGGRQRAEGHDSVDETVETRLHVSRNNARQRVPPV